MGILLSLVVLSLAVLVHEYGHYVAMRRNGVKVVEFTIGFGPVLWSRKLKSGTMFHLKPILLGGYTKPVAEGEGSMAAASRWARFKILFAGPLANAIAAFVVALPFAYLGYIPDAAMPYIDWAPAPLQPLAAALLGSFGICLATPAIFAFMVVSQGLAMFKGLAGPVGIISMGNDITSAAHTPLGVLLGAAWFFYVINIALGGFNLVPLIPLDGGHILGLLVDKFGGKHRKGLMAAFTVVSLALFVILIIGAFTADFLRLTGRMP